VTPAQEPKASTVHPEPLAPKATREHKVQPVRQDGQVPPAMPDAPATRATSVQPGRQVLQELPEAPAAKETEEQTVQLVLQEPRATEVQTVPRA